METVKVTKVNYSDKKTDGTPLINKFGKPYFKVGIQTKEYGDTWINGLCNFAPKDWEGQAKELEIYDEEYNGKTYKKFKVPSSGRGGGMTQEQFERIMAAIEQNHTLLKRVIGGVQEIYRKVNDDGLTSDGSPMPNFDPK